MEAGPDAALTLPNRSAVGQRLADRLSALQVERPVVLAIPRGGAPVGLAVSRALGSVFDLIVSLELTAPEDPRKSLGAVAEFGGQALSSHREGASDHSINDLESEVQRVAREVVRRAHLYRGERMFPAVEDRTVVVVADGVVDPLIPVAALRGIRSKGPRHVIFATGVMSRLSRIEIRREAQDVITLREPEYLAYVAEWYREFPGVTDEEIQGMFRSNQSGIAH
ncbi:MAG: phosphoribosyltransferase [Thermoplasmata archaeon]